VGTAGHEDLSTTILLVTEAQRGDRSALERLFERYLPRVRQIVALRLGERLKRFLDAEDMVQEVLLDVFQGLKRFVHQTEGSFRNWLARCVECEIADAARGAQRKKRGGGRVLRFRDCDSDFLRSSIFATDELSPSRAAMGKEINEEIEAALLQLPKHHREVIVLRHLCGMSYAEVAQSLGLHEEATARKAVSRALRKLKDVMMNP
jgi:RNA polymerase sigma-70 factor (ECF subfamily)